MSSPIIAVSQTDLQRLESVLDSHFVQAIGNDRPHLKELKNKLERASVIDCREMQPDIVTMNSTFNLFDIDRNESDTFTLVYPDEACIAEGKLSILSPLGAEVFGLRVGATLTLHVLNHKTRKRVEKISFQPERAWFRNRVMAE
ncbi:GreA/GreB family elongation factor [Stieleria sp. TO1_6]|uniref:GreA/GreB family elongation factor n=1 Tax=Stieleria tagensis TaxID=2956795 RepID=UPI00209A7B74|nr:GreA/GreB family elongation factor [Stieleria tagensis]MCO8120895.1 GreA/GreB family elongation factor [Stieleria tagensis]